MYLNIQVVCSFVIKNNFDGWRWFKKQKQIQTNTLLLMSQTSHLQILQIKSPVSQRVDACSLFQQNARQEQDGWWNLKDMLHCI